MIHEESPPRPFVEQFSNAVFPGLLETLARMKPALLPVVPQLVALETGSSITSGLKRQTPSLCRSLIHIARRCYPDDHTLLDFLRFNKRSNTASRHRLIVKLEQLHERKLASCMIAGERYRLAANISVGRFRNCWQRSEDAYFAAGLPQQQWIACIAKEKEVRILAIAESLGKLLATFEKGRFSLEGSLTSDDEFAALVKAEIILKTSEAPV
jgi:hypothetical protein